VTTLDERPSTGQPLEGVDHGSAQALFEEARQRRRRRHRMAGITLAVLTATAALSTVFVRGHGTTVSPQKSNHEAAIPGPRLPPMPSQMVIWGQTTSSTMSIEVIATKTGHIVRTLASDDGLFRSTPQPTVSALGTVYFDDSVSESSTTLPNEHVMSIPLTGGVASVVAPGHDPAVSPNGRLLAYQTYTDISDAPEAIVVRNLVSGTSTTWQFATNATDISSGLSWSPNSTMLVFQSETSVHGAWNLNTRVLDVAGPGGLLDSAQLLSLPLCPAPTPWASPGAGRAMTWAGLLNDHDGLGVCHHAGLTQQDDWYRPFVVNLKTGHVMQRLPVLRGLIGSAGAFQVDASGHYLAFIGTGIGAGGLYRWTVSGHPLRSATGPVLVKNRVGSAAWVPRTS
jgi:hypothetical protein